MAKSRLNQAFIQSVFPNTMLICIVVWNTIAILNALAYHLMFPIILSVQLIVLNAKCSFNIWAKIFPYFNVLTGTKLMKPNAERLFQ